MKTSMKPCSTEPVLSGLARPVPTARGADCRRGLLRTLSSRNMVHCQSSCIDGVVSAHPDAVRRRQEAEARKRELQQEQGHQSGHWWDVRGSANLVLAKSPMDLMNLVEERAKLVVVKYFAPHCVACKTMFPKIKQIAETNPEVLFVKVNAGEDEMRAFCEDLGIDKVPFFHFYEEGSLTGEFTANLQSIGRLRSELAARRKLLEEVSAAKRHPPGL